MAKQKGPIRIEGTLNELSFYSSVFGDIVRRKGGASKEKIRKSPKFKRLRSHQEEFKGCIAAAKLFRNSLYAFTREAPDHTLVGRVNKLMITLKNLDNLAPEGERQVTTGLHRREGKLLLQGFELNSSVSLDAILKLDPVIEDGRLEFSGFIAKKHIKAPKGTTHVRLSAIVSKIDFSRKIHVISSAGVNVKMDNKKQNFVLKPKKINVEGYVLYFLAINFFSEGIEQTKEIKRKNCLTLLTADERE